MPGPCSLPDGASAKYSWDELNETVCDIHFNCDMRVHDKNGDVIKHDYITFRNWLAKRHRLTTGKTR